MNWFRCQAEVSLFQISKIVTLRCDLVFIGLTIECKIALFSLVDVAVEREVEGDLILGDMGSGVPFRAGSFDGIIRSVKIMLSFATPSGYRCLNLAASMNSS